MLFYIYARAEENASMRPVAETITAAPNFPTTQTSWRAAKRISYTGFIYILVSLAFSLAYVLHEPSKHSTGFIADDIIFYMILGFWAVFQTLLGIVFLCVQSVPQVITTFRTKRLGSLSIPTMCMQVPGYFIWAAAMRGRYPAVTWVPMLVAGAVQGVVLVLSLYWERERKRDERAVRLTSYEDEEDSRGEGQQVEDGRNGPTTSSSKPGPISL